MAMATNFVPDSLLKVPTLTNDSLHHLLMLELSTKCVQHLTHSVSSSSCSANTTEKLPEREYASFQCLSGCVVHKIYLKPRKRS